MNEQLKATIFNTGFRLGLMLGLALGVIGVVVVYEGVVPIFHMIEQLSEQGGRQ